MRLRIAVAGLIAATAALTIAPAGSGADSPAPPAEYQALYSELSQKLTSFEAGVDAGWDGIVGDGQFAATLSAANGNKSVALLSAQSWTGSLAMLDAYEALGVSVIKLEMEYPVQTPEFQSWLAAHPPAGYDPYTATVPDFIGTPTSFYNRLVAEIRARGLVLWIEHGTLFADYSTTPPGAYFADMRTAGQAATRARYTAERSAEAALVVSQLAPDYYTILEEPDTQNDNFGYFAGQAPLFDLAGWTGFVGTAAAAIDSVDPGSPTLIGAGSGTWGGFSYPQAFAAMPELDFVDLHMYPLQTQGQDYLQNALDWADYVRATDPAKFVTIGEAWLYKASIADLIGGTPYNDILGRDVYSFWEPLDRQHLRLLFKMMQHSDFKLVMPFWTQYFWGYLEYGDPTLEGLTGPQLIALAGQRAAPNLLAGILTGTGKAFEALVAESEVGTFHCTGSAACPEITIAGDPPATLGGGPAPFRGYADPSMEYDPVTGELWMAYSWLDVMVGSPGPPPVIDFGVRTHLAKSTDGGQTWTFVLEVNDTSLISHPDSAAPGWLIHEVPTIAKTASGWEALWLTYFDPQGGAHGVGNSDQHYRKSAAATPGELGDASTAWVRGTATSPSFGAVHNLSAIPQLGDCIVFTEPALLSRGGETYLATNCVVFSGGVRQPQQERLVLLREDGGGYEYVGVLLDYDDAVDNGGERIEQVDLAMAQNGAVLLIGTPIQAAEPNHLGCVVFEVTDLGTASVRRDGNGKALKLMQIAGDDPGLGAGLCTYDAQSATGVVMVLHDQDPPSEIAFSMRATGQHPLGTDTDADGLADTADNCPAWPNPAQGLPLWSVPAGDSDCDGFPDSVTAGARGRENFIGTDAADQCADDGADNAWPPDVNNSRATNLSDVVLFGPTFNKVGPNPPYNARFDLNASGAVNLSDIVVLGGFFNKSCTP
jgi:hypothetical protein